MTWIRMTVLFVCLNSFENLDQTYNLSSLYGRSHQVTIKMMQQSVYFISKNPVEDLVQCWDGQVGVEAGGTDAPHGWRKSQECGHWVSRDLGPSTVSCAAQLLVTQYLQGTVRCFTRASALQSDGQYHKQQCVYALTVEPT